MTEFKIIRLGHQGDGIADGPLFAPMTLPGEIVTATQEGDALKNVRIQTPSSDRVAAPLSSLQILRWLSAATCE